MEKTIVVIKPDSLERNLVGKIIDRYENAGLKIVNMKMLKLTKEFVAEHYPDFMAEGLGLKSRKAGDTTITNHLEYGKKILKWLRDYLTETPVIAILFEGENAVKVARDLAGYTDPAAAEKGTIRGDFGNDSILKANRENRTVRNLIHVSGSREEAEREIKLWFKHETVM